MNYTDFIGSPIEDTPPCLAFFGDHHWVLRAQNKLLSEVDELDRSIVTPPETITEAINKASSFPFLSPKRVVVVKEFDKLKDDDKKRLLKYAEDPVETTVFVLIGDLFKTYDNFTPVDCSSVDADTMKQDVIAEIERSGCSITPAAIKKLIDYCEQDMGKIISECVKLSSFVCHQKPIDVADVEGCVTPSVSYKIYQLSELVAKGSYVDSYTLASSLELDPGTILANLTKYYRNVFYAKINGGADNKLAANLGVKPYPLSLAAKVSKNYTAKTLYELLQLFYKLEFEIKSGATTGEQAVELAIAQAIERRIR